MNSELQLPSQLLSPLSPQHPMPSSFPQQLAISPTLAINSTLGTMESNPDLEILMNNAHYKSITPSGSPIPFSDGDAVPSSFSLPTTFPLPHSQSHQQMHPIDYQHLLAQLQYQNIQAQNLSQIQVNSQFNFMNMNQIGVMSNNSGFNGTESRIATIPARQDAIVNTASDTDSNSKIMIGRLPPKQQQHADPAYIQKRQAHIQMERRYRKDLNSSIQQLNSVIPVSQVNPATNKTKILQRAAEYIKFVQSLYPELTMICSAAAETNSDQLLDNGSSSGTKPGRKRARKQKLAYSSTTSNRSSQCTMLPPDEAQSRVVENQIRIQQQEEKLFQLTKRLEAATAEQYDMWTKQYQVSLENDKTKGLKEGVNEVNVGAIDGGVENGLTMELSSDVKLVDACPPNPFQLPTSFSFPSLINATLNESEIGVLNANHLGCSNSQMVLAMAETELQNLVREPAASGGKQK